jgi:heterodisulfide reductase subunit A
MEMTEGTVLVIGAGIGGIRASLDLAEMGYKVILIESSPYIGGILAQLDYQFPTDHCGMCKMLPLVGREDASQFCMRKGLFHDNIMIKPFTEVKEVSGEPGKFEVVLIEKTRQVDIEKCNGCGKCVELCPVEVPDEFNEGLTKRKAIYRPVPHNLPNMYLVDQKNCNKCGQCMINCPTQAIDLFVLDVERKINAGAIIVAGGVEFFDYAPMKDLYGCGDHPNVLTSLQFERILSKVGPSGGKLLRPSDGKELKRIAWLQCVGSRNLQINRDYCSSICCMFALKEAVLAKELGRRDCDCAIFYMDMRTFGKEFYRYQMRARDEYGVRLIRSRVHTLVPVNEGDLSIRYFDEDGKVKEEKFDLVVLSTGQNPSEATIRLAEKLGISTNQWGFITSSNFSQVKTEKPGIFVCGSSTGIRDISETLIQAGAAANEAAQFLISKGIRGSKVEEVFEERDVKMEKPRISIILCTCMSTLDKQISFEEIKEKFNKDHSVDRIVMIEEICSDDGISKALNDLAGADTNRLLIGACLPYVYKKKLLLLGKRLGLSPELVEIMDIRSPVSWGDGDIESATSRIRLLISQGIEKLKRRNPIYSQAIPVIQKALVVGGGIAGMTAALDIAKNGYEVTLVERTEKLGGQLQKILFTLEGLDPHRLLADVIREVAENDKIKVLTEAEVIRSQGYLGNFRTIVEKKDRSQISIDHGVTIIATGGHEAPAREYRYGESERIMTQEAFEEKLAQYKIPTDALKTVVMIQCVGSRDEKRPYCSRICCSSALKNALKVIERNKEAKIYILYRDLMSYGFKEEYYTRARREGIKFITYTPDRKPEVDLIDERPVVKFEDPILKRPVEIHADFLILSTGIVPNENSKIASVFSIELNEDGFFQEAEPKWRPVEFIKEGIFLCGTAHSPRSISESIAQAKSAAQRALSILSGEEIRSAKIVADVKTSLCTLCETCITLCPYEARMLDEEEGRIVVLPSACQGCGTCAVACPSGASFVRGLEDRMTMSVIDATLEDAFSNI